MNIEPLLAVTRRLAGPFDLGSMLEEVVAAAKEVLEAERGSVWLYDEPAHELVLRVSTGLAPVRVPADAGIVGTCARNREAINVRDCYSDPRFNPELDRQTHFRTRCMLTLPLVDHKDSLVGVLQVLNKANGVFDDADEKLATSLAAQCAVALQRAQMTEALIDSEKMRRELEMARQVQMDILPAAMPEVPGYDISALSRPADMTGGDTFDLALAGDRLLLVLGDATGHGLGPALHVTQMHAMLRMALRLGADLDATVFHLNNQLVELMAEDRFITAFIGTLDTSTHRLAYHSAGQAPILHYVAAADAWRSYRPTSFPLGAMAVAAARKSAAMELAPGDVLVLLSDGVYEYHDAAGEMFGEERVKRVIGEHRGGTMEQARIALLEAVAGFANGAPQEDDITVLLVKRRPAGSKQAFAREIASLDAIFGFTAAAFDSLGIDASLRHAVDFTIEELFTNMVKYGGPSREPVEIEVSGGGPSVRVTLTDRGVDAFDITRAPDADIHLPLEERKPGGLGLHLIRRLVDTLEYRYDESGRTGFTTFGKKVAERAG
jgi:phosphoserine phosphatase